MLVGSAGPKGFSKPDRAKGGKQSEVIGLISVASSLVPEGKTTQEVFVGALDLKNPPADYDQTAPARFQCIARVHGKA